MMGDDLVFMDASAQADAVKRGHVSPAELVEAAIGRAEGVNPKLNAIIHQRFERARDQAKAPGMVDRPLGGVPFLIKDLIAHSAGDPFHEGIRRLASMGFRETTDTELVRRFRAAGLVDIGRTNTSELGLLPTTEPEAYGPTRNPWDPGRSPLGSGGGSAAAVAAGIVPLAHSNDGGGSIRMPASACGLIGLKPSRARVSLGPEFGDAASGAVAEFVVTRSVRDTAVVLDAVASTGWGGEPYVAPQPVVSYAEAIRTPRRLRVGLMVTSPAGRVEVHPVCAEAVGLSGRALEHLGHHVDTAHPAALDEQDFAVHAPTLLPFGLTAFTLDWWERRTGIRLGPDDLEAWTWTCAEMGRATNAGQYLSAVEWVQAWARRLAAWWSDGFDLLVTPTVAEPPPLLGTFAPDPQNPFAPGLRSAEISAFTYPFNMSGQPAVSLPLYRDEDGLPIGVQLVAALGREDLLLATAAQLEAVLPWTDRRPRISAAGA
jgi:amidase